MKKLGFIFFFLFTVPVVAQEIRFDMPIDCNYGKDCYIQNYVDVDSSAGRKDYTCGRLSYDGHKGTDFRLLDYPAMRKGVAVKAAADGIVLRTRNSMEDINVNLIGKQAIKGMEAGNGVFIDHGNSWTSIYSHMKKGSVSVKAGQQVKAGDKLGIVGLSGKTEFPHLHFGIKHNGKIVDPFMGAIEGKNCFSAKENLWKTDFEYIETAPLIAGFAPEKVDKEKARQGQYNFRNISKRSPMVMWAEIMGTFKGDVQIIQIFAPDGNKVFEKETTLASNNVNWFAFSGRRPPKNGWQTGTYTGTYTLTRNGKTVVDIKRTINVR